VTAADGFVIAPKPVAHFGVGAIEKLPDVVRAAAAIEAVAGLRDRVGLTGTLADWGMTEADFPQIAADALDDEVLASTAGPSARADIETILAGSG
jgi:alcohol dehydrogenase class IV